MADKGGSTMSSQSRWHRIRQAFGFEGYALFSKFQQIVISLHPLTEPPLPCVGNKHWLVDRSTNPHFTGRREVIERIVKSITSKDSANEQQRLVITGMGGQGKSELCLHVANEVRER